MALPTRFRNERAVKPSITIVALFALAALAHADPNDSMKRAAELYDVGRKHFDLGEYKEAIASWKQAYMLSSASLLLFNIGQAYRLSGNCAQANRFYVNYQRVEPHPTNKAELDAAMSKCKGVEPATSDATDPPATTTTPTDPSGATVQAVATTTQPTEPGGDHRDRPDRARVQPSRDQLLIPTTESLPAFVPASDRGRGLRLGGAISAGVGVIALGAGTVFALQARDASNTVSGRPEGTAWNTVAADDQRGQDAALRAQIAFGVGAAAVITGGVLWFVGHRKGARRVEVSVTPGRTEVSLSCAF